MHSAGGNASDDASHFPASVIYHSWVQHGSPSALKMWAPGNQRSCFHPELTFIYGSLYFDWCPTIAASVLHCICLLSPDTIFFFSLSLITQLPFGDGLFHFYPQDTSKRRSKRSARIKQWLQNNRRVSTNAEMSACAYSSRTSHSVCVTVVILGLAFLWRKLVWMFLQLAKANIQK